MTTQTVIKALVGTILVVLGATGVISPDDASNEEAVDTVAAGVGAVVLLFTPKVNRGNAP